MEEKQINLDKVCDCKISNDYELIIGDIGPDVEFTRVDLCQVRVLIICPKTRTELEEWWKNNRDYLLGLC